MRARLDLRLVALADPQRQNFRAKSHRTIWQTILRIGGTVILSMLLAYVTEVLTDFSTALTAAMPGQHVADLVVAVPPPPNELSSLRDKILVAFAVDSTCYLVLILGLSALVRKSRNKPGN
jgi:hypothetical protein